MSAWLVETLVAATALMLLVLLLRQPVRQLFGAQAAYALWLLPALRMLLPPLGALFPAGVPAKAVTHAAGTFGALVRTRVEAGLAALPDAMAAPLPPVSQVPHVSVEAAAPIWPSILVALWLVGLVIFLIAQWFAYRRFCGFILSEATLGDELAPGILLVSSPRARGPMAFGVRRRFVVLPADADRRFDEEERAMALAHELAHHARGDLFANVIALAMLALHWCNPVAWIAYRAFRADQEMACDADVIASVRDRGLGHAYARALVKSASGHEFAIACNLNTVDRLKRRLAMLSIKSPSDRRRWTAILLTGALVLSGLILTASGEGMAAQVGARVSAALPLPLVSASLPSLPAVPVIMTSHVAPPAHAAAAPEARIARLTDATDGDVPAPPAPPAAPMGGVVLAPPAPPAPPVSGVAPVPPALPTGEKVQRRTFVLKHQGGGDSGEADVSMPADGKGRRTVIVRNIRVDGDEKDEADWGALAPDVKVLDGKDCSDGNPVKTTETYTTVDGQRRQQIIVTVCHREIARKARMEAMEHMAQTRNEIAAAPKMPADVRKRVIADLERQIARLKAEQGD